MNKQKPLKGHTLAAEFGLNPMGFSKFVKQNDEELRRQREGKEERLRRALLSRKTWAQ
ncbi:hypothetical protein [Roseimicrobium sp. ORNL1]|uniref:hypothetical protein n=1 Tax=Roseimicrobium sp. ORNL1 TaxID=2711231 RepID=UPI0013E1F328|nr:hypothetical protein [Roseimicrobium sp. ORNL1]QIF00070.1 hypothetical protein G5S37_00555 [Roseimicrobium sp. ORNL1]